MVLLERLRALGYDGGMSILKEYVHPYRPARSSPAVRRYETPSIEFVSRCDLRSMERCMLNAFLYFGGVPKEVLTDNMKTVVAGREAGKVIWNTQFSSLTLR